LWDIQDPEGKICLSEGDNGIVPTESTTNRTTCGNSSSVIRLHYAIHKNADYPSYRIFQKECEEEFEAGTEPIVGSMPPDEDKRINLSKSATSDLDERVTASLEILLADGSLTSPWWRRLTSNEEQEKTIEFCIRMGLWLPPQAGKMEVNFRETNVAMIFEKEANGERDGYVVKSVVLEQKELISVNVNLMGSSSAGKIEGEQEDEIEGSIEKKDEL
jgi:hypothetical protein